MKLARLTRDLSELSQQQAATAEVLQVISNSTDDLQPVFASILEKAVRLCRATFGNIYRWDGKALHLVATHNTPPALAAARRRSPLHPYPGSFVARMVTTKAIVNIPDLAAEELYIQRNRSAVEAVVPCQHAVASAGPNDETGRSDRGDQRLPAKSSPLQG
jgi:hypothetical protein